MTDPSAESRLEQARAGRAIDAVSESGIVARTRASLAGHVPALDGIRGIAILLVLAHNFDIVEEPKSIAGRLVDLVMNVGWIGVQLFFVLSGFLITSILIETRDAPNAYRAFFGRRLVRIFPLAYAALAVAFFVLPRFTLPNGLGDGREHQLWFWTYLCNWAEPLGRKVAILPHFWSLAVEEQFYLVWPFVVLGLPKRALLPTTIVIAVVALVARVAIRAATGNTEAVYMFTICRIDALAIGAACSVLMRAPGALAWLARRARFLTPFACVGLAVTFLTTRGLPRSTFLVQSLGYSALAVLFAVLVVAAALDHVLQRPTVLTSRVLRTFGKYSYGMYVFHQPLHLLFGVPALGSHAKAAPPLFGVAYFLLATAVTFGAAFASYHLFEKHFLKLKRYFTPLRAAPAAQPSQSTTP